jgi:hypothetical protein
MVEDKSIGVLRTALQALRGNPNVNRRRLRALRFLEAVLDNHRRGRDAAPVIAPQDDRPTGTGAETPTCH